MPFSFESPINHASLGIRAMTPGFLGSDLPLAKCKNLITDPKLGCFCIFLPSLYATMTKKNLPNCSLAQTLMIYTFCFWKSNKSCIIKVETPGFLCSDLMLAKRWNLITNPILSWFCMFLPSLYATKTKKIYQTGHLQKH